MFGIIYFVDIWGWVLFLGMKIKGGLKYKIVLFKFIFWFVVWSGMKFWVGFIIGNCFCLLIFGLGRLLLFSFCVSNLFLYMFFLFM